MYLLFIIARDNAVVTFDCCDLIGSHDARCDLIGYHAACCDLIGSQCMHHVSQSVGWSGLRGKCGWFEARLSNGSWVNATASVQQGDGRVWCVWSVSMHVRMRV